VKQSNIWIYFFFPPIQPRTDPRRRSTASGDFEIPRTSRHFTNSSFSIAAPTAWNKLPTHIRTSTTLVIVSIQTQDSPVHYIICCSLGLVTMYGTPELWLWGALENAILINRLITQWRSVSDVLFTGRRGVSLVF